MSGRKPRFLAGVFGDLDLDNGDASATRKPPGRNAPAQILAAALVSHKTQESLDAALSKLKALEGSQMVCEIAATDVALSEMANRQDDTWGTEAFAELRSNIKLTHGNVVPGLVVANPTGVAPPYTLIYGSRRLKACSLEGVPFRALVLQESDARKVFELMTQENMLREDLTPLEKALHFRRGLDAGLYPSQNQLADAVGLDRGYLSRLLQLADLPQEVTALFKGTEGIQTRWARLILDAREAEPAAFAKRVDAAKARIAAGEKLTASQVLALLTEAGAKKPTGGRDLTVEGKKIGSFTRTAKAIALKLDIEDPNHADRLEAALEDAIKRVYANLR